jgi:hypothetical protein
MVNNERPDPTAAERAPAGIDATTPHPARIYDYALGGKDNFAVDRALAEEGLKAFPQSFISARASRVFLIRVVRYLTAEAGIRQFLDIGAGLPTSPNVHEVAQAIAPESRVVYVDNDPVVICHARALLTSGPKGATGYIDADLRDVGKILGEAAATLDLRQPVGIVLAGILHYLTDAADPYGIVARLAGAVPAGSYLAIAHLTGDLYPEEMEEFMRLWNENAPPGSEGALRSHAEVCRFFDGLELVEPGVVQVSKWRPDSESEAAAPAALWGGAARKR